MVLGSGTGTGSGTGSEKGLGLGPGPGPGKGPGPGMGPGPGPGMGPGPGPGMGPGSESGSEPGSDGRPGPGNPPGITTGGTEGEGSDGGNLGVSRISGVGSSGDVFPFGTSDNALAHRVLVKCVPSVISLSPLATFNLFFVQKISSPTRYETWKYPSALASITLALSSLKFE